MDSIIEARKNYDSIRFNPNKFSTTNIEYLKKIIAYYHSKGKNVYLLRSPQDGEYDGKQNEHAFDSICEKEFSSLQFLDFNEFELNKSDFADLEHLNYEGANKFSKWFNQNLKLGVFSKL